MCDTRGLSGAPQPGRNARLRLGLRGSATVLLVLLLVLALVRDAGARTRFDQGKLEVTADELVYHAGDKAYVARGNVDIVLGERSIQADWIAFSTLTERGVASGNVRVADEDDTLQARFVEFNLETLEGVIFGADLDAGENDFLIRAEILQKVGDETYSFNEATFTACRCPKGDRLPWKLRAKDGDLTLGGYVTAKNTTVEVLGVPALWLPWAMFPVKTERESGVLFPIVGFGSVNGFEIGLPLFWAARDELNVTFTPSYLEKRGFKPDLEFEYLLGSRSHGVLYGSFIHDERVAANKDRHFSPNRWAFVWEADQWLPAGWHFRSDVKLVSDNRYAYAFDDFARYRDYRYLESSAYVVKHFLEDGRLGLTGSVLWANDLQTPDTVDRDPFLVQRLPELEADVLSGPVPFIPGLVASVDTDYTYFFSERDPQDVLNAPASEVRRGFLDTGVDAVPNHREPGYEDPGDLDPNRDDFTTSRGPELDGRLQDGEPLTDRGSRIVVYPKLAYPLRLFDTLEFYPEVGYYQTLYFTEEQDFAERGLVTARADLLSRFTGTFDLPLADPVRHILEPRVSWAYVQKRNQQGNPVFIPPSAVNQTFLRQLDMDSIVMNPADRIHEANLVTVAVDNRFYSHGSDGVSDLVGDLVVEAGYDIAGRSLALINMQGRSKIVDNTFLRFLVSLDPDKGALEQGEIDITTAIPSSGKLVGTSGWWGGGNVGLAYRWRRHVPLFFDGKVKGKYDEQDPINQVDASIQLRLFERWRLAYGTAFSLEEDRVLRSVGEVTYTSKCDCWEVGVSFSAQANRAPTFRVMFQLLGVGDGLAAPGLSMGGVEGAQAPRW